LTLDERSRNVVDSGTPILILNCYDFDEPPPWRSTVSRAGAVQLPAQPDLAVRTCATH
jgi:hypothetical protein